MWKREWLDGTFNYDRFRRRLRAEVARIHLGGSFAVRTKAQVLVSHCLYSRIRNPIYVFAGLTLAGTFLFAGALKLLWILATLVPLQVYQARKDEKVFVAQFGERYRAYKARTWF